MSHHRSDHRETMRSGGLKVVAWAWDTQNASARVELTVAVHGFVTSLAW